MLLTWKLKKLRLKEQKKLNPRNSMIYKSMTKHIQNSTLTNYQKEEALQQVMDIILQAQIENKSVNLFIGVDIEEFCDSIIKEYTYNLTTTYKILDFIQSYMINTALMLFVYILFRLFFANFSLNFSISLDVFITASVLSLFLIPISKKNLQKNAFVAHLPIKYSIVTNKYIPLGLFVYICFVFGFKILKNYLSSNFNIYISKQYIYLFNSKLFWIIIFALVLSIQIYKNYFNKQKS